MYNGLRPVSGLRGAQLNEMLELRAEQKMSLITPSVTPPIEDLGDDKMSKLIALRKEKNLCLFSVSLTNVLHQTSSFHLVPAGNALVDSPLELGIRSPAHND